MFRSLFLLLSLLLITNLSIAQKSKTDKKLLKAQELVQDNKIDKAEKYLTEVLEEQPDFSDGWELLLKINLKQYEESKIADQLFNGNISITSEDKSGKKRKVEDDSVARDLVKMLAEIRPSKRVLAKFLYNCRLATASTKDAIGASVYLRNYFADIEVDSAVNKKALKYFDEGEKEFSAKNYAKAALLYKRALELQPDFYKAEMYLGDCFYAMKNFPDAIISFKEATVKFPDLLEPSKYLTDAYMYEGLYEKSIDEAIRSFNIYPDFSMFVKLGDAAYLAHKKVNVGWTARGLLPNKMADTSESPSVNSYAPEKPMKAKGPWVYYEAAMKKVAPYCSKNGIIQQPNKITSAKYLEVYSWQEMLKNSNDTNLDEARKMQKLGFLDCYVMTTCFHQDFYEQYKDFVAGNADRIREYYHAQIKEQ